ncbi:MAG: methyltransferase domain-containing protein [Acidobacteriota bacterium]
MFSKFKNRSHELERIDTGDYTPAEYERFLGEIAFINRFLGDARALKKTLLREVEAADLYDFSVLDVGAGSGELLRQIDAFAACTGRKASLAGLDLNDISAAAIKRDCSAFPNISTIRGDALKLPLADNSFDYAISSLFFHHLTDEQIVIALKEMTRVARRGIFVIDLHRHPAAYALFRLFCFAFRISPLVREDGSLSILRGFKSRELRNLSGISGPDENQVERKMPFRLVICKTTTADWRA